MSSQAAGGVRLAHRLLSSAMDSFENFQYDTASSYGGMGSIVDDTSSVYTGVSNSQGHRPSDLESLGSLSLSDRPASHTTGYAQFGHPGQHTHPVTEEDVEAVLDDLKDEGQVDLPPHACR